MYVLGCVSGVTCDTSNTNIVYSYRLAELTCQQWDDVTETWSSDSCEVLDGSTATEAKFKSNLFGSLGAGLAVGPNTIDFSSVFDNLDAKLAEVRGCQAGAGTWMASWQRYMMAKLAELCVCQMGRNAAVCHWYLTS